MLFGTVVEGRGHKSKFKALGFLNQEGKGLPINKLKIYHLFEYSNPPHGPGHHLPFISCTYISSCVSTPGVLLLLFRQGLLPLDDHPPPNGALRGAYLRGRRILFFKGA